MKCSRLLGSAPSVSISNCVGPPFRPLLWGHATTYLSYRPFSAENESSSSTTNRSATSNNTASSGEELYKEYLQLRLELENLRREKERQKSEAMYEAWEKTQERELANQKSQGVAVVKTLVKETRKQLKKEKEPERQLQQEAQQKLEAAALKFGHADALVQLGNQALTAATNDLEYATDHINMALELYQKGGENGSREGWFNHGHLLWTGFPDQTLEEDESANGIIVLHPDQEKAFDSFEKAISLGDTDAMYFVGVHLLSSIDSDEEAVRPDDKRLRDVSKGLQLIEQAAESSHGSALYYLALFHLGGHLALGIPPCEQEEFCRRLDAAVEAGNEEALFLRGHSYYHGENGYRRDYRKALEDFLRGADAGHADAAVSAGAMLHSGDHVPRDQSKAFELYQHAGELGSLEGWRNVAACYATGEGVAQSLEMAKHITKTMKLNELAEQE